MTKDFAQAPLEIDRLLRQNEVELLTGLSPSFLEHARTAGNGPAYVRVSKRAVRYRLSAVVEFIDSLTP